MMFMTIDETALNLTRRRLLRLTCIPIKDSQLTKFGFALLILVIVPIMLLFSVKQLDGILLIFEELV